MLDLRKLSKTRGTCEVYKLVLQGEDLSTIKAPAEIKDKIRRFMNYPAETTGYQISMSDSDLSSDLTCALRKTRRAYGHKKAAHPIPRKSVLGETVRQIALGVPKNAIKQTGVDAKGYQNAEKFIKLALKGASVAEISEKLQLSESYTERYLEAFNLNYRKIYESKQQNNVKLIAM